MANGGITAVQNRPDGHQYYVIGADGSKVRLVSSVKTISERNALSDVVMCLVTEAYKGDPTVNRGWALYIATGSATTTQRVKWVKIAEEESVDGPWGLQQEVLNSLVKKPTFTAAMAKNAAEHEIFQKYVELFKKLDVHTHSNKPVLNALTDYIGQLYYKGAPIGGGIYVYKPEYDDVGTLVWKDPTTPGIVESGMTVGEIARKFAGLPIAYAGQILSIVEPNGDVSSFVITSIGENIIPVSIGCVGNEQVFGEHVNVVTRLPAASKLLVDKGVWLLVGQSMGGNKTLHTYKCVASEDGAEWIDLDGERDSATLVAGPKMTLCYKTAWNKTVIAFTTPDDASVEGSEYVDSVIWDKTYVVRKIGSAPTHKDDGVVVCISSIRDEFDGTGSKVFVDTCPVTNDPIFYGVFGMANNGAVYAGEGNTAEALFPDWAYMKTLMANGNIDKLLEIGDSITLPKHDRYGSIVCNVLGFTTDGGVMLIPETSIAELPLDGVEYGKAPAEPGIAKNAPYYRIIESVGNKVTFALATDIREGSLIEEDSGIFIGATSKFAEPSGGSFILHGENSPTMNSNLLMWLNSYKMTPTGPDGWFVPSSAAFEDHDKFDRLADELNMPGFLCGFPGSDDASTDPFLSMVKEVRLPSSMELDRLDVSGTVWVSDQNIAGFTGFTAKTNVGNQYPEVPCGVMPVIILKAK